LRTLGARRAFIREVFLVEYALLGAVAALFGLGAGCAVAWAVVEFAMKIDPVFAPGALAGIAILAVAATVALGALSNGRLLADKPARSLRAP
jgi:putative ABC transport system permease protein